VIPLSKLIVREKADSRDGCGVYLICQSRQSPEMYELVCRSVDDRRAWTATLKNAIANCPQQSIGLIHRSMHCKVLPPGSVVQSAATW